MSQGKETSSPKSWAQHTKEIAIRGAIATALVVGGKTIYERANHHAENLPIPVSVDMLNKLSPTSLVVDQTYTTEGYYDEADVTTSRYIVEINGEVYEERRYMYSLHARPNNTSSAIDMRYTEYIKLSEVAAEPTNNQPGTWKKVEVRGKLRENTNSFTPNFILKYHMILPPYFVFQASKLKDLPDK